VRLIRRAVKRALAARLGQSQNDASQDELFAVAEGPQVRKLSFNVRRGIAAVLFVLVVLSSANYYLDWGYLGGTVGAKRAVVLTIALMVVFATFLAPTHQEFEAHRKRAERQEDD
jgi:hypothetical protein